MKLGIFGGSFNPPHLGHLIVLESLRDVLRFDRILFIPSAQTPNKPDNSLAPPEDRLEMTKLAVDGNPEFEVSDIEVRRHGPSYTVDTIGALVSLYGGAHISLIIGSDNLLEFGTWKNPREILAKADLVVMSRPGFDIREARSDYARLARFVSVPQVGISGTDIRRRVKLGRSIRYLVPGGVEDYITYKRLYRE